MVLDSHVLAFHDADFAEAFAERGYIVRTLGIGGPVSDKPNHRHRRLLCPRRERPCCRASEQRDELAPHHASASQSPCSIIQDNSTPGRSWGRLLIRGRTPRPGRWSTGSPPRGRCRRWWCPCGRENLDPPLGRRQLDLWATTAWAQPHR